MSVANVYGLYAVDLNGTTVPVQSWSMAQNIANILVGSSGDVNPTFVSIGGHAPVISFTTTALKIALDKLATPWQALSTAANFYFRPHTAFGTRGTSGFIKAACATGMLVPRPITGTHGGVIAMGFDYFPVQTDGTAPIVVTTGVADPALGTSLAAQWTVGPCRINATSPSLTKYTGVQTINIDPGINVTSLGGDGEVFPSFVGVNVARPSLLLTLADAKVLADLGLSGVAQDAVNDSIVYLTKLDANGTRVAKATAEHISFGVDDGIIVPQGMTGNHPDALTSQILITPTYDGTNVIVAVNTATAIPVST